MKMNEQQEKKCVDSLHHIIRNGSIDCIMHYFSLTNKEPRPTPVDIEGQKCLGVNYFGRGETTCHGHNCMQKNYNSFGYDNYCDNKTIITKVLEENKNK